MKERYLILSVLLMFTEYAQVTSDSSQGTFENIHVQKTFDDLLKHLNYQHLYHPYTFNSGIGNREDLVVEDVQLDLSFVAGKGVNEWTKLRLQNTLWLVGIRNNGITVVTIVGVDIQTYHVEERLIDFDYEVTSVEIFDLWNYEVKKKEAILMVVIKPIQQFPFDQKNILWYNLSETPIKKLWEGPSINIDKCLKVFKYGKEFNLIFVNEVKPFGSSIELHRLNFNNSMPSIRFLQSVPLNHTVSSIAVTLEAERLYLSVVQPGLNAVIIYKFEAFCPEILEGKLKHHKTIASRGVTQVKAFTVANRNYLTVNGEQANIYIFNLQGHVNPDFQGKLGFVEDWMALNVENYRDDVILLARQKTKILVLTWAGTLNGFVVKPQPPCSEVNKKLEKIADISEDLSCLAEHSWVGATFMDIGHVPTVVFPGEAGYGRMFHVISTLTPVSNPDWDILKLELLQRELDKKWEELKKKVDLSGMKVNFSKFKDKVAVYNDEEPDGMRSPIGSKYPTLTEMESNILELVETLKQLELEIERERSIKQQEAMNFQDDKGGIREFSTVTNFTVKGHIEFKEPILVDSLENKKINIVSNAKDFNVSGYLMLITEEDEMETSGGAVSTATAKVTLWESEELRPELEKMEEEVGSRLQGTFTYPQPSTRPPWSPPQIHPPYYYYPSQGINPDMYYRYTKYMPPYHFGDVGPQDRFHHYPAVYKRSPNKG